MGMEKEIKKSVEYVKSKLCSDGGYSFYRHPYLEESSIYDTYYAIRTLLMVGEMPSNKTVEYIASSFLEADTLEKYYFSIRCIELLEKDIKKYRTNVDLNFNISRYSLEDINLELLRILRFKRISKYFDTGYNQKEVLEFIDSVDKSDIKTLSLIYAITEDSRYTEAIENYFSPYFGIVPIPGLKYTNISTLYAGYWLLYKLGKELKYLSKAKEFVIATQDRHGAFSETKEALPDLRSNYCGFFILNLP